MENTKKIQKKNVGIIFSGGPAPAANTVISACALSFFEQNIGVIGFFNGYEFLQDFNKSKPNLFKDSHYVKLTPAISEIRNQPGIFIRTSRANPGKGIKSMKDFEEHEKIKKMQNIIDALEYLDIDALISIGGDDTLKTANFLNIMGVKVIHIPKTIDNDYFGIPWTFGFWTSVNVAKNILLNLHADAKSANAFVIAEMMGRKSGWITYAAGIAGEAIKMVSVEDIEKSDEMDFDKLVDEITDLIILRKKMNLPYGVICVAEGLVEKLPDKLRPKETDKHGNLILADAQIGDIIKHRVTKHFKEKTGTSIKIIYKQVGYETRSTTPISYDVVMASMLGYGASKLFTQKKFGHMVSLSDNFDIKAVPFKELIDPKTLLTKIRFVPRGSDLHDLKQILGFREFEEL